MKMEKSLCVCMVGRGCCSDYLWWFQVCLPQIHPPPLFWKMLPRGWLTQAAGSQFLCRGVSQWGALMGGWRQEEGRILGVALISVPWTVRSSGCVSLVAPVSPGSQ